MTSAAMAAMDFAVRQRPGAISFESVRDEARVWLSLAIAALGVAGAFALMLAVSRVPGIERIVSWPIGFFAKGLVIHVVFSLVVWFLAIFALLATLAVGESTDPDRIRLRWLGTAGTSLVAMSFPLLFLPSFLDASTASLNNYIPVISHPTYYVGLITLFLGILCPGVRLLANAPFSCRKPTPMVISSSVGVLVYVIALVCFGLAFARSSSQSDVRTFNEYLFWGGGHVLQFLNTLMLLTGWHMLARETIEPYRVRSWPFNVAVGFLAIAVLAAPLFYFSFPAFSASQQEAFRRLQFVLSVPTTLLAAACIAAGIKAQLHRTLSWREPALLALCLSIVVFGAGGVMGLLIGGADTRTPAHYHGVIAAVNLACMGMVLKFVVPLLTGPIPTSRRLNLQFLLFGFGQLAACIGLFWAGGYGAPRKTPGGSQILDKAMAGLYLNGIGAVIAVVGGLMFVFTVASSLKNRRGTRLAPPVA